MVLLEWEMRVHQQIEKGRRCSRWVGESCSSPHPYCLGHAAHHLVPWTFKQGQVPLCLTAFGWAGCFLLLNAFPQDTLLTNSHAKFKPSSIRSRPPYSSCPGLPFLRYWPQSSNTCVGCSFKKTSVSTFWDVSPIKAGICCIPGTLLYPRHLTAPGM